MKLLNSIHVKIVISIIICLAIGGIGGYATSSSIDTWYTTINKPSFNPPNWVFAPVWTLLYFLMGLATGIVWHEKKEKPFAIIGLRFFAIQLVLNLLWSFLFFYFESPILALIELTILIVFVFITIKWYQRINKTAHFLLYPYFAWICFAWFLNYAIWSIN